MSMRLKGKGQAPYFFLTLFLALAIPADTEKHMFLKKRLPVYMFLEFVAMPSLTMTAC